jgi:outer membrane protein OmpA-like peptidoglycan-associated protein/tetratricopeptide (TPR) repeat protein
MKKQCLVIALFLVAFTSFGQAGKLKKANNYFDKLAYSFAAELYEELIGSELDSPTLKSKLATCYYLMGNTVKAENDFALMINSPEATKDDFFYYAQALKQNGKYSESDIWMAKVNQLSSNDSRGLSYANNTTYFDKIEGEGARFEIKNLNCNSSVSDFGAYPSVNGKQVYFISSRRKPVIIQYEWPWNESQYLDVYKSDVDSINELSNVSLLDKKVNTRFHEGPLCFSSDGKYVYFTRSNVARGRQRKDKQGIQNLKLFRATIDQEGNWNNEEELPFNSKEYSVGHPSISNDGKDLYFVSNMPGGFGGADLYKATINPDGTFGKAENLGLVYNTEGQEMFPWFNVNGDLFFSSNGHIGLGGLDVFVMETTEGAELQNVGMPVNSQSDDFAFTMNKDNLTGFFSSNRAGGKGDDDIYSYTLIKPIKKQLWIVGIARDAATGQMLVNANVDLLNEKGVVVGTVKSDNSGSYTFKVDTNSDYVVAVSGVEKKQNNQRSVTTKNIADDVTVINGDVNLEKEFELFMYCLVTDSKSLLPLEGVKITVTNNETNSVFIDQLTSKTGDAEKEIEGTEINEKLSYTIQLEKEGYLTKVLTFEYNISQGGRVNVHESLDLTLDKIDVGIDLASIIEINPIYFDFDKYDIRADAEVELKKIVKVMNENPSMVIELGSHTDCRSSIEYNQKLSDNRAKASAAYIQKRISNPERIYGKGYGESKLKVNCPCEGAVKSPCSKKSHQQNRRTEFVIIKM